MPDDNQAGSVGLPLLAVEVPQPNADAQSIAALVKESGRVTGYRLSDGRMLNKQDAVALAKQGGIRGVGISSRKGNEYLKSLPDQSEENNLGNLPSIAGGQSGGRGYGKR